VVDGNDGKPTSNPSSPPNDATAVSGTINAGRRPRTRNGNSNPHETAHDALSDEQLMLDVQRGDGDAFTVLFDRYNCLVLSSSCATTDTGQQGTASGDASTAYINGEVVEKSNVVIWYCAHLGHHAVPEHADEYHACGPTLIPFRWN
jgi:hypothetical protein